MSIFLCLFHEKPADSSESGFGEISNHLNSREEKGCLLESLQVQTCLQHTDQRQDEN